MHVVLRRVHDEDDDNGMLAAPEHLEKLGDLREVELKHPVRIQFRSDHLPLPDCPPTKSRDISAMPEKDGGGPEALSNVLQPSSQHPW
jgi:hypothetical protein